MKVALPEQFEFQSEDKSHKLLYKPGKEPVVVHPKGKWTWKGVKPDYPSDVVIAPESKLVYMLGSYGDAGIGLGLVEVYDIQTGKIVRKFDIKLQIPNLDMLSKAYGEQTNFPWISGTKLVANGTQLEVKVCGDLTAKLDSKSDTITVTRDLEWFKKIGCEELTIQDYEDVSGKNLKRKLNINDATYIKSLQVSINQLPTVGEKMVDMAESTPYLTLEFKCDGKKEIVEFYGGQVKTPDTSFYVRSRKLENDIWTEIQSLFSNPEMAQKFPYYVGQTMDFGDFTISYQGWEDRTPKGTSASSYLKTFKLHSKKDKSIKNIEVRSGQLPAPPVDFEVNGKKYILHTFSYENERLHPRHLLVTPK